MENSIQSYDRVSQPPERSRLFDHLVRPEQHRLRNRQADFSTPRVLIPALLMPTFLTAIILLRVGSWGCAKVSTMILSTVPGIRGVPRLRLFCFITFSSVISSPFSVLLAALCGTTAILPER